ncbi:hypothetical protein BH10PSE7_BH10PSE7_15360 [soil metagenome]
MSENSERPRDLFGDPVPANWGRRGRPEHIPTQENRNKLSMLVALGWSNERIAASLFVTQPTLRKHYFSELKFRDVARDRLNSGLAMKLWDQVQAGNVGAMREFQKFVDRNDLMLFGRAAPPPPAAKKEPKLGKKQADLAAAQQPDRGSTLGELMARRQGSLN